MSARSAVFSDNGVALGTYVLDDPYKPYLHPLRTPAGHVASLAKPYDHRHHKGLMYALATEDINFWEEGGDEDHPRIGRQRQVEIEFDFSSARPALRQDLSWIDDNGSPVFAEQRTIDCRLVEAHTVRWTWTTRLEASGAQRLRISPWSMPDRSGRMINYHGLGLRFPRSFSGTPVRTQVRTDAGATSVAEVHGTAIPAVEVRGPVDGMWPVPEVSVSMRQVDTCHDFFLLADSFVYLSVGPSTAGPVDLAAGDVLSACYEIDVSDLSDCYARKCEEDQSSSLIPK